MHFSKLLIGLGLTAAVSAALEPGKEMATPTDGYYILPAPSSGYPKAGLVPSQTSAAYASATIGADGSIRPVVVVPSGSGTGYVAGRPIMVNSTSSTGAGTANRTTTTTTATTGSASPTGGMGGAAGSASTTTGTNVASPKPTSPVSSGAGAANVSAMSILAVLGLAFLVL